MVTTATPEEERRYGVTHSDCHGLAFFIVEPRQEVIHGPPALAIAERIRYADGRELGAGDKVVCGACGEVIRGFSSYMKFDPPSLLVWSKRPPQSMREAG